MTEETSTITWSNKTSEEFMMMVHGHIPFPYKRFDEISEHILQKQEDIRLG